MVFINDIVHSARRINPVSTEHIACTVQEVMSVVIIANESIPTTSSVKVILQDQRYCNFCDFVKLKRLEIITEI